MKQSEAIEIRNRDAAKAIAPKPVYTQFGPYMRRLGRYLLGKHEAPVAENSVPQNPVPLTDETPMKTMEAELTTYWRTESKRLEADPNYKPQTSPRLVEFLERLCQAQNQRKAPSAYLSDRTKQILAESDARARNGEGDLEITDLQAVSELSQYSDAISEQMVPELKHTTSGSPAE